MIEYMSSSLQQRLSCVKRNLFLSLSVSNSEATLSHVEAKCPPDPVFLYVSRVHIKKTARVEKTFMSSSLDSESLSEAKAISIQALGKIQYKTGNKIIGWRLRGSIHFTTSMFFIHIYLVIYLLHRSTAWYCVQHHCCSLMLCF